MNAIEFENISKLYRLGSIGTGTLSHDLNRWWCRVRGKEDPYLKIGQINDRTKTSHGDYVWALKDISFNIAQGDVVGIIGRNGAGKSTLLKILSKITTPTTGVIRARGRIASLLEVGTGFHGDMTGRENIYMNGTIMGMTKAEVTRKLDEIVDFAGVAMYLDTPVKRYSSGMKVRLGFAVAAFLEAEIMVLDEVLAVGDAEFQKKAIGKIEGVSRGEGRTILFISHNMAAVRNLCDKGVLLEDGMITYTGSILETVDKYFLNNGLTHIDRHYVDSLNKKRQGVIQFVTIERLSLFEMAIDDEIELRVTITNNCTLLKRIRILGLIVDERTGDRVGLFFTPFFTVPKMEQTTTVSIKVHGHNLSKGNYHIDFNLTDSSITSNMNMFHSVLDAVNFSVAFFNKEEKKLIVTWANNWGCHYYPSEIM